MNRTALLTLLTALALALVLAGEAGAVYHPRLGRFLQRDPVGYVDGMSTGKVGTPRHVPVG